MTAPTIEESLTRAEAAVADGESLSGTGFWSAVARVKRQPDLVDRYADRIAAIDTRAHRNWALLVVPISLGTTIASLVTLAGLAAIWWAYELEGWPSVIAFFVGTGVLLGTTHGLAHLVVGRLLGMEFTSWFIAEISRPQPGVKLDYATYLRAPPERRAWMHASGALMTKLLPFALIGAAIAADLPDWSVWLLLVVGVGQLVTDFFWSTKRSDWKKFRREMTIAQESSL